MVVSMADAFRYAWDCRAAQALNGQEEKHMKIDAVPVAELNEQTLNVALVKVRAMIRDREAQMAVKPRMYMTREEMIEKYGEPGPRLASDLVALRPHGFALAPIKWLGRDVVRSPEGYLYVQVAPGEWQLDRSPELRDALPLRWCLDGYDERGAARSERFTGDKLPGTTFRFDDTEIREMVHRRGFRLLPLQFSPGRLLACAAAAAFYDERNDGLFRIIKGPALRHLLDIETLSSHPGGLQHRAGPGCDGPMGPTTASDPVTGSESMGRSKDTWMGRTPLTPSRKVIPDNEPKRVHKPFPERAMKPIGWSRW